MHHYAQNLSNARQGQRTFALMAIVFTLGAMICGGNEALILAALFTGLGFLSILASLRYRASKRKWRERLEAFYRLAEDTYLNNRKG